MTKRVDEIYSLPKMRTLLDLKNDGVEYLTKWMTLDSVCKLKTIKNQKLFASFPANFNDSFDSQFRISEEDKRNLAIDIKCSADRHEFGYVRVGTNWTSDSMCAEIDLHIEKTHSTNIACFSTLDPIALESNHMWGLYANNGSGIALQYTIDDLISFAKNNQEFIDSCKFYDVIYSDNPKQINGLNCFWTILYLALVKKNPKMSSDAILTFQSMKSKEWQFEKEWRFMSVRTQEHIKKILPDEEYLKNTKIGSKRFQEQRQDIKNINNSIFDFIKPSRIIFGWNNYDSSDKNKQQREYSETLKKWAIEPDNKITCIELDKVVDYKKSEFKIKNESVK